MELYIVINYHDGLWWSPSGSNKSLVESLRVRDDPTVLLVHCRDLFWRVWDFGLCRSAWWFWSNESRGGMLRFVIVATAACPIERGTFESAGFAMRLARFIDYTCGPIFERTG